ncbi:hypothetical protein [Spirosoma fluviale]|uniref:Uncharacterized protein n=1 Tax=Spirosoma fluviale TaxID=1597977 RepID=A0A286FFA4_9BACT|nr:hypothetical protein [Spirosoma fluviale]SOD81504.1 hypothetical protein SAMN06269250_1815 [Spirosoma fluviale]
MNLGPESWCPNKRIGSETQRPLIAQLIADDEFANCVSWSKRSASLDKVFSAFSLYLFQIKRFAGQEVKVSGFSPSFSCYLDISGI